MVVVEMRMVDWMVVAVPSAVVMKVMILVMMVMVVMIVVLVLLG